MRSPSEHDARTPSPASFAVLPRGGGPRILVVEDEEAVRFSIARALDRRGYQAVEAASCAAAERCFREARPQAALLDYALGDGDGLQLMRRLRAIDADVPVVMLTAHGSIDLAVRAIKDGAEQFVTKPVDVQSLLRLFEQLLQERRGPERRALRAREPQPAPPDPFTGESPAIRRLAEEARRILDADRPVLIQGETGTGKGVLASWLHGHGRRAEEPFVEINCPGLSRELFETELFGHEKGAFTGAVASKPGLLEVARRGTVFLDELGEVDLTVQPKLLKVVEEGRFRRLGDVRDREVDVRLIAATHQDLAAMMEQHRFRADLYFRLAAYPLVVPPLRERPLDIPVLARGLLARICAEAGSPPADLSPAAEAALMAYAWPGNIRELRNLLERAVLLHRPPRIEPGHLSFLRPRSSAATLSLREAERIHIEAAVAAASGSVVEAARSLGLSRSALYQKLRKHRVLTRTS